VRVRDLLSIEELKLSLLTGEEHLDRAFTAVQITDLPDPGRYLSGGELVLTGLMWRQGPHDSAGFVDRLVTAGVAALGAGLARLGEIPADLVEACRTRGLPLLEVPVETSFKTISEVIDPRLAGALAGDLRTALGRHRRIVTAVAEGAGLGELFALMADELGITGGVLSATGELIAGDLVGAPVRRLAREYLAAARLPHAVRLPEGDYTLFAAGRAHRAAGWALVCAGDLIGQSDLGFELAACVALERTRMEEGRRVERRLLAELVGLACADGDPAEVGARLRTCGLAAAEPYAVVNVTVVRPGAARGPDPATLGGQVVEELLGRRIVAAAGADGAVGLVPLATAARPVAETVEALAGLLGAGVETLAGGLPDVVVSIGISAMVRGPSAIRGGVEEAGHARRLAEARGGGVVSSAEIYTHALLLATVPGDVRRSFAARSLAPLFEYDRRHQSELVRTLGTFLDCAGSWHACAERMHVHVNTVRYRIRRVEELTGRDLSTMADRVDLFLALRAS
jgi:hypothetical protein